MYVVEQDSPVMVKDIVVTDDGGSTDGGTGGGSTMAVLLTVALLMAELPMVVQPTAALLMVEH